MSKRHRRINLRGRCFWSDELLALYQHLSIRNDERAFMVRIALGTGLRVGELSRLSWADVRPSSNGFIIHVEETKTGVPRDVPATPELTPYLAREMAQRGTGGRIFGVGERTLERWWNEVCESAGVRNLGGIHGARHTYASWELALKRLDLLAVSSFLGHAEVGMTTGYYAVMPPEMAYMEGQPEWVEVAMPRTTRRLEVVA